MSEAGRRLPIGEVAERSGMTASRIRYYETRELLDPPERESGKRRYSPRVLRRLAIIDAAQRVGFSLVEIRDLLGSRHGPAHERLRRLALRKLPEIDELIVRATTVQQLLQFCGECRCRSIDECRLLEGRTRLLDQRALQPVPSRAAERIGPRRPAERKEHVSRGLTRDT
jgi:MerR family transcriptional regulator, redox-sensitive transcriptional activator SoxR